MSACRAAASDDISRLRLLIEPALFVASYRGLSVMVGVRLCAGSCSSFKPYAEIVGEGYSCLASLPAGRLGMLYVQIDTNDHSLGDPLSNVAFQLVTQNQGLLEEEEGNGVGDLFSLRW